MTKKKDLTERMLENMVINGLKGVIEDLERLIHGGNILNRNPDIRCPSTIVFLGELLEKARAAYKERTT